MDILKKTPQLTQYRSGEQCLSLQTNKIAILKIHIYEDMKALR